MNMCFHFYKIFSPFLAMCIICLVIFKCESQARIYLRDLPVAGNEMGQKEVKG